VVFSIRHQKNTKTGRKRGSEIAAEQLQTRSFPGQKAKRFKKNNQKQTRGKDFCGVTKDKLVGGLGERFKTLVETAGGGGVGIQVMERERNPGLGIQGGGTSGGGYP